MRITYYCAMSADEYIATEDGDVSFLDEADTAAAESTYEEFFASVDGLVMGRGTYPFVFDYGSWPYGDIPTWIITSNDLKPLEGANLSCVSTVDEFVADAESKNMQHLWLVGGGKLASAFLDSGILTHLSITKMPMELGSGIPLFFDHKLAEIESSKSETLQKQGCQQIEVILQAH